LLLLGSIIALMNDLTFLPVPSGLSRSRAREASGNREELRGGALHYERAGALFWRSNHAPIPASYFDAAFVELPSAQASALRDYTLAVVASARAADGAPSAEQLAEMRAAFGTGTTVVNVLTGRRTSL